MKAILDFLNRNSGAFSVLFSAVVTAATVAYVWLTRRMAKETILLRKASSEPLLTIHLELSARAVTLVEISPERRRRRSVRREARSRGRVADQTDQRAPAARFQKSSSKASGYLAPKQTIRFTVGVGPEIVERERQYFTVTARYRSSSGEQYAEPFIVSVEHYLDLFIGGRSPEVKTDRIASRWSSGRRRTFGGAMKISARFTTNWRATPMARDSRRREQMELAAGEQLQPPAPEPIETERMEQERTTPRDPR